MKPPIPSWLQGCTMEPSRIKGVWAALRPVTAALAMRSDHE
jgi:hypothetical protein